MKSIAVSMMLAVLLLGAAVSAAADNNQNNMLNMLDQLDQLDKADFNEAIKAVYACSDKKDFKCADKQIKTAKTLVFNANSKSRLTKAQAYRQKAYEYARAEKRQLALEKRQKTCAARCPIAEDYRRCVAKRMSARNCSARPQPSTPSVSKLALLNNALQQLNTETQNYFQQRQQLLQQQQDAYAQQRRQKQRQQQQMAQQKRNWERAQAQQKRDNQQRKMKLAALRKQQQQMRRQAEQARQKRQAAATPSPKLAATAPSRANIARANTASSGSASSAHASNKPAKAVLTGEMLTWKNKAGKWWACGPIQCIWSASDTEKQAIGFVYDSERTTYSYNGPVGKCRSYTVTGVNSYDMSSEKVRRLAKCF